VTCGLTVASETLEVNSNLLFQQTIANHVSTHNLLRCKLAIEFTDGFFFPARKHQPRRLRGVRQLTPTSATCRTGALMPSSETTWEMKPLANRIPRALHNRQLSGQKSPIPVSADTDRCSTPSRKRVSAGISDPAYQIPVGAAVEAGLQFGELQTRFGQGHLWPSEPLIVPDAGHCE